MAISPARDSQQRARAFASLGTERLVRPVAEPVQRYKIAITSDCNLRCDYCFIDKERGETMSSEAARHAVAGILASAGAWKVIGIYGGEPLAHFDLVRLIVRESRERAAALHKRVCCSVATNGTLIRPEHLNFFREHETELCVSLAGFEDRERRHGDGRLSCAEAWRGAALALRLLPRRLVTGLLCVHPESARRMAEDFSLLVDRGFRAVNLEVIQGVPWSPAQKEAFRAAFGEIGELLRDGIESGRHVFLLSAAKRLAPRPPSEAIEIYPSGKRGDVAYPFLHLPVARRPGPLEGWEVLRLRDELSESLARSILEKAETHPAYRRHVARARKRHGF